MNSKTYAASIDIIADDGAYWTPVAWTPEITKHVGRPSDDSLAAYIAVVEASNNVTVISARVIHRTEGTIARYGKAS